VRASTGHGVVEWTQDANTSWGDAELLRRLTHSGVV
jgi:hypothetical protein